MNEKPSLVNDDYRIIILVFLESNPISIVMEIIVVCTFCKYSPILQSILLKLKLTPRFLTLGG